MIELRNIKSNDLSNNTNRNFVGIEKDEKYFSIAKLRMEGE